MMQVTLTYSGTSPSVTVTITSLPDPSMVEREERWLSPGIKAAAGEDSFVADNGIVKLFDRISLRYLLTSEYDDLIAVIAAADGISNECEYVDLGGDSWAARIMNANEIEAASVDFGREEMTLLLMIEEL